MTLKKYLFTKKYQIPGAPLSRGGTDSRPAAAATSGTELGAEGARAEGQGD